METKSLLPWFLVLCIVFLIISIITNTIQMFNSQKRLYMAQKKVETLEKEQQRLIHEKTQQTSDYYIESQIRNNLKLVKPGEVLVVIPSTLKQNEEESVYKYSPKDEKEQKLSRPIHEWIRLIL